jgi:hypothetical protein
VVGGIHLEDKLRHGVAQQYFRGDRIVKHEGISGTDQNRHSIPGIKNPQGVPVGLLSGNDESQLDSFNVEGAFYLKRRDILFRQGNARRESEQLFNIRRAGRFTERTTPAYSQNRCNDDSNERLFHARPLSRFTSVPFMRGASFQNMHPAGD